MSNKLLITICLIIITNIIYAQVSNIKSIIDSNMANIRNGVIFDENIALICSENNKDTIIPLLTNYCTDTMPDVRKQAYRYIVITAINSNDSSFRAMVVEKIANSCFDTSIFVVSQSVKMLTKFTSFDYSINSKNIIDSLANYSNVYTNEFYKIAAFVKSKNAESILLSKLDSAKSTIEKWHIHIALARLGNNKSVSFITNKLGTANINNGFINSILPDLIFTKQKPIFDYLLNIVLLDNINCVTNNPVNSLPLHCGYFIIEKLGYNIEGFPLEYDKYGDLVDDINQSDFNNIKKWITENKDYIIIDNKY